MIEFGYEKYIEKTYEPYVSVNFIINHVDDRFDAFFDVTIEFLILKKI